MMRIAKFVRDWIDPIVIVVAFWVLFLSGSQP